MGQTHFLGTWVINNPFCWIYRVSSFSFKHGELKNVYAT